VMVLRVDPAGMKDAPVALGQGVPVLLVSFVYAIAPLALWGLSRYVFVTYIDHVCCHPDHHLWGEAQSFDAHRNNLDPLPEAQPAFQALIHDHASPQPSRTYMCAKVGRIYPQAKARSVAPTLFSMPQNP
jgi:hypothetical protein